jgi:hypothetical protein
MRVGIGEIGRDPFINAGNSAVWRGFSIMAGRFAIIASWLRNDAALVREATADPPGSCLALAWRHLVSQHAFELPWVVLRRRPKIAIIVFITRWQIGDL